MARIIMNLAGLDGLRRHVEDVKHRTAEAVAADARRFCPVDTGALRASIRVRDNAVWVGGPGVDYWACVEYGSRPHVIESHGPWPLRNRETGQVFGRRVNHPGTPAQPFMRPALMRERHVR